MKAHVHCCSQLHAVRVAHARYIYAGGLSYELTEGDVLAVFSQARQGDVASRGRLCCRA